MMRDESSTAFDHRHDWFEYAYYTSAAVNGGVDNGNAGTKPLRLQ